MSIESAYENTSAYSGEQVSRASGAVSTERLNAHASGYLYHPRFVSFSLHGSGGLRHTEFSGSAGDQQWTTGSSDEHHARVMLLPRHPYTLELYTSRVRPATRGGLSRGSGTVTNERGANFRYRWQPLTVTTGYAATRTSGRTSSDSTTRRGSATVHTGPVNTTIGASRTDSTSSQGSISSVSSDYLDNVITLGDFSLRSMARRNENRQDTAASALNARSTSLTELFTAALPWNFGARASYGRTRDELSFLDGAAELGNASESETRTTSLDLTHRIYDSVRTQYSHNASASETTSGDVESRSDALSGAYTKRIPEGRIVAGGNVRRAVTNRSGAVAILGEPHPVVVADPLTNPFPLAREHADPASIVVRAKNPDTGLLEMLTRDLHYAVEVASPGTIVSLRILLLPFSTYAAAQGYELFVSYTLNAETVKLETTGAGYSLRVDLFDNFFSPYVNHSTMRQEVLSGVIGGGPEESTTNVYGVAIQKRPVTFLTEYQRVRTNINPSETWRGEVGCQAALGTTGRVSAKAHYLATTYAESVTSGGTREAYDETVSGANATFQKSFPRNNLNVSLSGSFIRRKQSFLTQTVSLGSSVTWSMAKLTFQAGADISRSAVLAQTGSQRIVTEYYYMNITRALF